MNPTLIAFAMILLAGSSTTATAEATLFPPEYQVAVEEFLASARTRSTINERVGIRASRCVELSAATELCQWSLRDRQSGWKELARAIHTRDRVSLICELPIDGSRRAEGSCTAHPQRSNRGMFAPKGVGPGRNRKGPVGNKKPMSREASQRVAQSWLDGARTLIEMSRLMGSIPSACESPSGGARVCIWRATAGTYGHGTVAASIKAGGGKKVRLHCRFPIDGSERAADSCSAHIGS